jgi:hypothetical protein
MLPVQVPALNVNELVIRHYEHDAYRMGNSQDHGRCLLIGYEALADSCLSQLDGLLDTCGVIYARDGIRGTGDQRVREAAKESR